MVYQGRLRMPDSTHMVPAAEVGAATRPANTCLSSCDLPCVSDSPAPGINRAHPGSLHCQQAPQAILDQSDGGTTAPPAWQDAWQEAASTLSQPVCCSSTHDDGDALPASCHDHQPRGDTGSSAVGLSSCGGKLGGQTAGQVLVPQQSSSLQRHRSGSRLLAVCLQVDEGDGVTLTLNTCKHFASAFPSASAFLSAFPFPVPLPCPVPLPSICRCPSL